MEQVNAGVGDAGGGLNDGDNGVVVVMGMGVVGFEGDMNGGDNFLCNSDGGEGDADYRGSECSVVEEEKPRGNKLNKNNDDAQDRR